MNSQLFFILNLVFGGLIFIWFLTARRKGTGGPTRLKMQGKTGGSSKGVAAAVKRDYKDLDAILKAEPHQDPVEKALNVFFNYNGHSWDAYEVLGVPAGAKLTLVTERYQSLVKAADKGKIEFLECAYKAILEKNAGK